MLTSEGNIEKKVCRVSASTDSKKSVLKVPKATKICRDCEVMRNMTPDQLKGRLQMIHEYNSAMTEEQLRHTLKKCERTPHWLIWHDHSSIASSGFMLFLVREVYDPAVHITSEEYKERHGGKGVNVQSTIEAPHLYMSGASRAKDSDQLVLYQHNGNA